MVNLSALWLPILVSAVLVFLAGNVLWMALPFWHSKDYRRFSNPKAILDALAGEKSGQYLVPMMDWKNTTPAQQAEAQRGPAAYVLVRNPSPFSFGTTLASYFVFILVVMISAAYLAGRTRGAGADYLEVFRVAGTAVFLAFGFRGVSDSIWYGKPWTVTTKELADGLIYGLLAGGVFGWLWPR